MVHDSKLIETKPAHVSSPLVIALAMMAVKTAAFATGQIGGLLVTYTVGPNGDFSCALLIACLLLVVSAGALSRPRPVVYATSAKDVGVEPS